MAEVDMKIVEEKLIKGENLSQEEMKAVMSAPPDDAPINPNDDFTEAELDKMTAPEKKEEPKKEEAGKEVKKEELKEGVKKEEITKTIEDKTVDLDKIKTELDKPDGEVNLAGYTEREKGIFWDYRRERRGRQAAEAERDVLLRKEKIREKEVEKNLEQEAEDIFKDRPDDEPLTIKDIKAMREANKKIAAKKQNIMDPSNPLVMNLLKTHESVARKEIGADFDETVECSTDIIADNPQYLRQVAEALVNGENTAKVIYDIVKGDPGYAAALPKARARLKAAGLLKDPDEKKETPSLEKKPEEKPAGKKAVNAQEKMEANKTKTKTSAHVEGTQTPSAFEGYTYQQLLNMPDKEFRKVPKKVREAFLRGDSE